MPSGRPHQGTSHRPVTGQICPLLAAGRTSRAPCSGREAGTGKKMAGRLSGGRNADRTNPSAQTAQTGPARSPSASRVLLASSWAAGGSNAGRDPHPLAAPAGRDPGHTADRAPRLAAERQPGAAALAVPSHPRTLWHSRWQARLRGKLACCGSATVIVSGHPWRSSAIAMPQHACPSMHAPACPSMHAPAQAPACMPQPRPTTALPVSPAS